MEVVLYEPARELMKGGARIRLQQQPFEILQLLLARRGGVVTRDELRDRLWPDGTFVDFEHSLNAAVKRLRAALGDDARAPRYIETLPRRGYRWIATTTALVEEQVAHSAGGRIQIVWN
jgi:DNA-binding winged helix-turn-helix (wHTH) protein